jgi:hypothetical protein
MALMHCLQGTRGNDHQTHVPGPRRPPCRRLAPGGAKSSCRGYRSKVLSASARIGSDHGRIGSAQGADVPRRLETDRSIGAIRARCRRNVSGCGVVSVTPAPIPRTHLPKIGLPGSAIGNPIPDRRYSATPERWATEIVKLWVFPWRRIGALGSIAVSGNAGTMAVTGYMQR